MPKLTEETYLLHAEITRKDFHDGSGDLVYVETDTDEIADLPISEQLHALIFTSYALQMVAQRVAVAGLGPRVGPAACKAYYDRIERTRPMDLSDGVAP